MGGRPDNHRVEGDDADARPPTTRLIIGGAILAIWPFSKIVGPIIILASDYSTATKALLIGLLFTVVPKICVLSTVLALGRSGFFWLRSRIMAFLDPVLPPQEVGRSRYRVGLVLFTLPFFIEWSFPYTSYVPAGIPQMVYILSWVADLTLVISLFVLGGAFWRKLRALFIRTELADFSAIEKATFMPTGGEERWRLLTGGALILIGALGLASTPLIGVSTLSSAWQSQLYGWAAVGPIVMFIAAALIVRRSRATRLIAMMTRGLPETVGRTRHIVGLVMFVTPIIFGFSIPHLADAIPGYATNGVIFGLVGNAVLLASLVVLGGGFWGKFEALYVQHATIRSA
ncbi:MAG: hypothetical protein AAGG65_07315 [Pseudomonadota bacterium]